MGNNVSLKPFRLKALGERVVHSLEAQEQLKCGTNEAVFIGGQGDFHFHLSLKYECCTDFSVVFLKQH